MSCEEDARALFLDLHLTLCDVSPPWGAGGGVRRGRGWNMLLSRQRKRQPTAEEPGLNVSRRRNGGEGDVRPGPHPRPNKGLHAARPAGAGRVPGEVRGRDRGECWWQIVWWRFIPTRGLQEGELRVGGRAEGRGMRLGEVEGGDGTGEGGGWRGGWEQVFWD